MNSTQLENLISGCKQGERKAQALLYKLFSGKMLAVCRRYTKDSMEAEDVLQEGFVTIFTKINLYEGKGSFEGWMRRIMVNMAISAYRKNQSSIQTTDIEDREYSLFDNSYTRLDEADYLLKMLNSLPAIYRIPFNLFAIEGYSHQEIAEMTGITEMQSRVNVCRARTILKKKLEPVQHNSKNKILALQA